LARSGEIEMTKKILAALFVTVLTVAAPLVAASADCCAPGAACCTGGDCC